MGNKISKGNNQNKLKPEEELKLENNRKIVERELQLYFKEDIQDENLRIYNTPQITIL